MIRIYPFLLALALSACEPMQVERSASVADFYCFGELQEHLDGGYLPFYYRLGDTVTVARLGQPDYLYVINLTSGLGDGRTQSQRNESAPPIPVLRVRYESRPEFVIVFEFSEPSWPTWGNLTRQEVEDHFRPGQSFSFGSETGKVDVLMRLPSDDLTLAPWGISPMSRASFLHEPSGTMTITDVEDLTYDNYDFSSGRKLTGNPVTGKRITCTFEGNIARYEPEGHQGDIEDFRTDKALPLRNGEAVFFVAYE